MSLFHCQLAKSIIFQSIPVIALRLWKKPWTIFIPSPLKALMEDQVNYLNGLGLKAITLMEEFKRVIDGEYSHVYGSPESFLSKDAWRDVFSNGSFRTHLIGIAIDEVHCISHWYVLLQFLMHIFFPKLLALCNSAVSPECNIIRPVNLARVCVEAETQDGWLEDGAPPNKGNVTEHVLPDGNC